MKVTVTVDLSEFYSEDETDFSTQIKDAIAYDVKNQILSDWREKVKDIFGETLRQNISDEISEMVKKQVKECFNSKTVKSRYSNDFVTIPDYISKQLDNDLNVSRDFQNRLDKISSDSAKSITQQLKDRYDLIFASNLVSKMNELNMLKPDVAKLILE